MMAPGVLAAAVTVLIGWITLAPLRDRMGLLGYHLAAVPAGALGWTFVAAVSMALRSGWSVWLVAGSLIAWCAVVWLAIGFVVGRDSRRRGASGSPTFRWATYVLYFLAILLYASLFARLGVSAFSADGWSQYEPDGIILQETGVTTPRALGNRMVVVSALHAAYHFFGGEFTHVIQPVMGLVTALLVAAGIWWSTAGRMALAARVGVTVVPVLAMLSNAVYAFHSVYIHSHMTSAMFLILAIVALMRAFDGRSPERAWLFVAGLGGAGLLLARPDGAAYSVVVLLTVGVLLMREQAGPRATDAFFTPFLAVSILVIAGGVAQHGIWWTKKLSLATLAVFIIAYAAWWVLIRAVSSGDRLAWLRAGSRSLWLIVAVDVAAVVAVWRIWVEQTSRSVENMASNLLSTGGYRSFWPVVASMVVVSMTLRPLAARHRFTAYALFAAVQFLAIAFVLHAVRHPGRIGWGDSFTRVSFQIVPVLYLYVGLYLSELFSTITRRAE